MSKIRNILVVLMLFASIGIINAKTLVSQELVLSEYGDTGAKLGIGDRVYKNIYDDGIIEYILERTKTPQSLYIGQLNARIDVPKGGDPRGYVSIPVSLIGLPCKWGVGGTHNSFIDFYYTPKTPIGGLQYLVPCDTSIAFAANIPNEYFGARINTPGDYELVMYEVVTIANTAISSTESRIFTLRVLNTISTPVPTPTPTTPAPSGSYIIVNSNVAGTVYIDNVPVGLTGKTYSVAPGGHDVKVSQNGYSIYTTSVIVDYGKTVTVQASLNLIFVPTPIPTYTLQPTPTPTPSPTPGTITPTPTPSPTPACAGGTVVNGKCVKLIPRIPGFESLLALMGLTIAVFLAMRKR